MVVKNIFLDLGLKVGSEEFCSLFESASTRIERIRSHSHADPENFWYDQAEDEWVMVLRGEATLEFAGAGSVELNAGDYLTIPRHVRHRVARTSEETIWLAVHVK